MATSLLSPTRPRDWDERKARNLLNRAGFGVPVERVGHLQQLGPRAAVDYIVDYEEIPLAPREPDFLILQERLYSTRMSMASMEPEERRKVQTDLRKEERIAAQNLKAWWIERMYASTRPLEEKLTLFWHGHFATSAQKVKSSLAVYDLNASLRRHASGNFKDLVIAVAQSPAMLIYLDNQRNVKGKPNENWARELMELFTLGVGNYTENDIKESARAFTGWSLNLDGFAYHEEVHDNGAKSFLGVQGNLDGWDIIDTIVDNPASATFICKKLWTYFAYEDPEAEIVAGLAETFRANHYELKPVLKQLFRSRAFHSERSMGTQIKSPVQLLVQLAHDLRLENPSFDGMARLSAQLGMDLFYPPNVKGWDGGRSWINANTLLQRYNMPRSLVAISIEEERGMGMGMASEEMQAERQSRAREEFRAYMAEQPERRRRHIHERMQEADSDEERAQIAMGLLRNRNLTEIWDVKSLFERLDFATGDECIAALGNLYLSVSLSETQRALLRDTLTPEQAGDEALDVDSIQESQMIATLHLLFSMAEYQLC